MALAILNRSRLRTTAVGVWLWIFTVGCGASGALSGSRYSDDESQYKIGIPGDEWDRVDVSGQNDLAWSNANGALIQVNANCEPEHDIPLVALTNHLLIGFTERTFHKQELGAMDGREALTSRLTAKLDGVTQEIELVVLKKNGCVYDFALFASSNTDFEQSVGDFQKVVNGFRTASPGRSN